MYTDYLKETLKRIAGAKADIGRIRTEYSTSSKGYPCYPSMCGALEAVVRDAAGNAESALRWTVEHIEAAEREAERIGTIFENLGIDLDEETLVTLELIGKRTYDARNYENSPYKDQRREIERAISKAVADTQENEREYEHDQATDALIAAGFVHDEENDCFERNDERVTITLVNGRESRYMWELAGCAQNQYAYVASGKSGEFSRLLALITPKSVEVAGIALGPFEWANDDNGNPVVTIALARDARSVPPQAKAEIGCDRLRGTAIEVSAALRVMAENCAGRMPMQSDLLLIHCKALQRAAGLLPEDDMEFERRQR